MQQIILQSFCHIEYRPTTHANIVLMSQVGEGQRIHWVAEQEFKVKYKTV